MAADDATNPTTRPLIDAMSAALDIADPRDFLLKLNEFGSRDNRNSKPGRDALLKYLKKDRSLSYSFALLLLEYIDDLTLETRASIPGDLVQILRQRVIDPECVRHRHAFPPRHDAPQRVIEKIPGTYVVIRPDTGLDRLQQEILILETHGKSHEEGFACLLGARFILRGRWCAVRDMFHVALGGRRQGKRSDIMSVAVAFEAGSNIYPSALLGISTDLTLPAFAPAICVRVADAKLGRFSRDVFSATDSRTSREMSQLSTLMVADRPETILVRSLLRESMAGPTNSPAEGTIIGPNYGMMRAFRDSGMQAEDLILPDVLHLIIGAAT